MLPRMGACIASLPTSVVESFVGRHEFVPNDVRIDGNHRHLLITGPNMAGKSTVMRRRLSQLSCIKSGLCCGSRLLCRYSTAFSQGLVLLMTCPRSVNLHGGNV